MKELLAEIAPQGTWSDAQKRALKAIVTLISNRFDGVLLLRGKRVSVEVTVDGTMSTSIDCPFKPKSVVVLSAYQNIPGDGDRYLSTPILVWRWTSTASGGQVTLFDELDLLQDGPATLDVFMEKS